MSTTIHSTSNASHIFVADMAALAAHLGGCSFTPRTQLRFAGGSLPASRCHCRMAAAITLFPAAKSAKPASSRRQTT